MMGLGETKHNAVTFLAERMRAGEKPGVSSIILHQRKGIRSMHVVGRLDKQLLIFTLLNSRHIY